MSAELWDLQVGSGIERGWEVKKWGRGMQAAGILAQAASDEEAHLVNVLVWGFLFLRGKRLKCMFIHMYNIYIIYYINKLYKIK